MEAVYLKSQRSGEGAESSERIRVLEAECERLCTKIQANAQALAILTERTVQLRRQVEALQSKLVELAGKRKAETKQATPAKVKSEKRVARSRPQSPRTGEKTAGKKNE